MEPVRGVPLFESERIDDLLTHELKIIQSHEVFCFSMDAVLLARFASVPKRGRILDFCTGNGAIPLIMTTRTPEAKFEGIEIQERLFSMASRNVVLNGLEERITMHHGDVKDAITRFGHGKFDLITCNPPYMPATSGEKKHQRALRHSAARNYAFAGGRNPGRQSAAEKRWQAGDGPSFYSLDRYHFIDASIRNRAQTDATCISAQRSGTKHGPH